MVAGKAMMAAGVAANVAVSALRASNIAEHEAMRNKVKAIRIKMEKQMNARKKLKQLDAAPGKTVEPEVVSPVEEVPAPGGNNTAMESVVADLGGKTADAEPDATCGGNKAADAESGQY